MIYWFGPSLFAKVKQVFEKKYENTIAENKCWNYSTGKVNSTQRAVNLIQILVKHDTDLIDNQPHAKCHVNYQSWQPN